MAVRRVASLSPEESAPLERIVAGALGPQGVLVGANLNGARGALVRIGGRDRWRIYVDADPLDRPFLIAHELGHWIMRREGIPEWATDEESANHIAWAILAPPGRFRAASAYWGEGAYNFIRRSFSMSGMGAALRDSVVTGVDLAVVAPTHVHVQRRAFEWPPESEIRDWATRPPRFITRIHLLGELDTGRTVLRVR